MQKKKKAIPTDAVDYYQRLNAWYKDQYVKHERYFFGYLKRYEKAKGTNDFSFADRRRARMLKIGVLIENLGSRIDWRLN